MMSRFKDVLYFPIGLEITFKMDDYRLGFTVGRRPMVRQKDIEGKIIIQSSSLRLVIAVLHILFCTSGHSPSVQNPYTRARPGPTDDIWSRELRKAKAEMLAVTLERTHGIRLCARPFYG